MTQNPYSPQDQQPPSPQPPSPQQVQPQPPQGFPDQPMNIYPAPGAYGAPYPGQQAGKPSWPTVVGIISLCVAGIFILSTIGTMAMSALGFNAAQERQMFGNMPVWFNPLKWGMHLFGLAIYALLAAAGAMLIKRRPAGRTLHLLVAFTEFIICACSLAMMIAMYQYAEQPANAVMPDATFRAMMLVSQSVGLAIFLAYPVFLLIWFSRAKVKQHISTWTS
jgi:hypothetical protein